jgi:hypothetical protein
LTPVKNSARSSAGTTVVILFSRQILAFSMKGRAAATIELSATERSFPEAQLRKDKAARSLSDRCPSC